jgi:dipeptidyl aminopeptidase/acylaminoacyl peptidase
MKRTLLALALMSPGWAQPEFTARALIDRPRPQECQFSPDGRWLAVQVGQPDWKANRVDSEVRIYRVGHWEKPEVTLSRADSARWSADSRLLLWSRAGKLWVGSTGDWKGRALAGLEAEGAIWSPDGRQIAFFAAQKATPRVDSGRLYDDLFVRRWNQYYDGRRRHLYVTDLQGHSRDVTPGDRDAGPTSGTFSWGDNLAYAPDGKALFYSAPPARGQASSTNYDVYRVELNGLKTDNLTAANPAADLGPKIYGDRLYVLSHSRPGYESDFGRLRSCALGNWGTWREENLGDELGELAGERIYTRGVGPRQRAFAGDKALSHEGSMHSLSCAGVYWAGIEGGLALPSRVVVGRLDGPSRVVLGQGPGWKLGAVESLEVPVEGASMQMWLIKPPGYQVERRWPLVVLVHGGPQGGWNDDWSLRWNAQLWAAQGYLVAMPNPRGSSGRGQAYQEQVSRDWGGLAYRDLMAGVDALVARPDVDPDRVAAAGASYGGYMVNWFAVNTGRFKALVTHCGVWNLESMYGTTDELWFADWEFGGPPWSHPSDYERFSPHRLAARLGQYKTPHLVIHNDRDYRCPIDQGLQLFTALQRQGVESRLLNFPDEGHWVGKPANSLRWYREVFAFVAGKLR